MNLQKSTIKKFKIRFPNNTYSEIAKITGIQQTRAFRIFNGSEMKLSEYESLNKLMQTDGIVDQFQNTFSKLANKIQVTLPEKKVKKYIIKFQRELHLEFLKGNSSDYRMMEDVCI
jgi:signal recognition particle GTPase